MISYKDGHVKDSSLYRTIKGFEWSGLGSDLEPIATGIPYRHLDSR